MAYPVIVPVVIVALVAFWISIIISGRTSKSTSWSARDHCLVAGGSQGLGYETARLLVMRGASVTLVARRKTQLEEAQRSLKAHRRRDGQTVEILSHDLSKPFPAEFFEKHADPIRHLFCCAGASRPGMLSDLSPEIFEEQMRTNYLSVVNLIYPFVRHVVGGGISKGCSIVMVGSTVSLIGIVGYAPYSAAKFALKGLAECLRPELAAYGINLHLLLPSGILSPGYEKEELLKPEVTKWIEKLDTPQEAGVVARKLLKGCEKGQFVITTDPLTELLRCMNRGFSRGNNCVLDLFKAYVGHIIMEVYFWCIEWGIAKRIKPTRFPS